VAARVPNALCGGGAELLYGGLLLTPDGIGLTIGRGIAGVPWMYLVLSRDDGVTWTEGRPIAAPGRLRLPTEELALAYVGERNLVGIVRSYIGAPTGANGPTPPPWYLASADLGRTWVITPTTLGPTAPTASPTVPPVPAGSTLATWEVVSPLALAPGAGGVVTFLMMERQTRLPIQNVARLWKLTFDPATIDPANPALPAPWILWTGPSNACGYPCLVPTPQGHRVSFFARATSSLPENLHALEIRRA
jgi:hypothetical protein